MYQTNLFVYGTLQRAGRLYELIYPAVKSVEPATLNNYALYKNVYGEYPLVLKDMNRKVKGELLVVDANHSRFIETMMMELKANYTMQFLEVRTPHGMLINALVFVGDNEDAQFLIEDGDWLGYCEAQARIRTK
jgi:gamma-glutamylcyclotransferase (GGCT)/AIG2-like uncharacterized protein YtfP